MLIQRIVSTIGIISRRKTESGSRTLISELEYHKEADKLLEKLNDYLDSFPDKFSCDDYFDINYSMGVLTAKISSSIGVYIINKQTPSRQIWLSSPISGPKRFDFINRKWIYPRENICIDSLLNQEFRKIFNTDEIDFTTVV
ncbi:unnamed protein product [Dracunculus medinensis]|uniref:ferroxidase n=1 Tax=Dracunculus medinensis TaxID=318479 RepID=A0A0N4UB49_DRAME|nr:unnamed protein product [Dracunculus medinensis]